MANKRRKNYFIKKKFQANFFIRFVLLLLAEGILISTIFLYVSRGTITAAYRGSDFILKSTGAYFMADFIVITVMVGAAIAVAGAFVFIYLSHRIGGAIYRFEKTVSSAGEGDFAQRVALRRTDELFELKDSFNSFLELNDRRISDIKREAESALSESEKAKAPDSAARVKQALKKIVTLLGHFKTSG